MRIEYHQQGFYLPEIKLWLDSIESCTATWISHGHSDHARGCHGVVIGTPATLRFYRIRNGANDGEEPEMHPLEFGASQEWNGARLTAFPAGHILGAAQLLVEYGNERLVYTGDLKLRPPLCGDTATVIPCDRLIIESTFGLPIYRLLTREEAAQRMISFARECLDDGITPAFIGYPLGRGQEIVHVLTNAEIRTGVHGAIAKFIPVYQQYGYLFGDWEPYDARAVAGKALVIVPAQGPLLEASEKHIRIAYVSGWAALDNARARTGATELIPYSDHADFFELMDYCERSGAAQIDTVHGYTEPFAHVLRTRGFQATAPHRTGARTNVEDQEG